MGKAKAPKAKRPPQESGGPEVPTVRHGARVYRLPFADLLRPLTAGEEAELRTSIEAVGVGHPVFVYESRTWGKDCVIDGGNRLRIAAELDADVRVEKLRVSDDVARRMAEDLNIARRQVTPDEARQARANRVERVAELRAEGKSLRAIADEVGVSAPQVLADVREATVKGLTVEPEKVKGLDGRTVAAKHKPAAAAEEPTPAPKPPPVEPGPEPDPAEEFAKRVGRLCVALDAAKKEAAEIAAEPVYGRHVHGESVCIQIEAARKALWQSRPTEACNCVRGGAAPQPACKACFGTGKAPASRVLKGGR